jgi:hypothetical protein
MMKATMPNWTGVATQSPRLLKTEFQKLPEIRRPGVYFLWGPDPEIDGKTRAYVGEGKKVWTRIKSHLKNKEFWNKVIFVTSNSDDQPITKTQHLFLEYKAYHELNKIGKATTKQNEPSRPKMSEIEEIGCEHIYEKMLNVLPMLGFPFLNPIQDVEFTDGTEPSYTFAIESEKKGVKATALQTDSGFVVLQGSTASKDDTESWTSGKELRKQLVKDGALKDNGKCLVFTRNVPFNSTSAASNIILARQTPGPITWKDEETGNTWKEIFSKDSDS